MLASKIASALVLIQDAERLAKALNPERGFWLEFYGNEQSVVLIDLAQLAGVKFHAEFIKYMHTSQVTLDFVKNYFPMVNIRVYQDKSSDEGDGEVILDGINKSSNFYRPGKHEIEMLSSRRIHRGENPFKNVEWLKQVQHSCFKGRDRIIVRPLLDWDDADIWEYVYRFNQPINPKFIMEARRFASPRHETKGSHGSEGATKEEN